jgi:hypothetical protein
MPLSGQAPMKCKQEQTDKVAILLNLKRKRWHRGLDDADEDLLESGAGRWPLCSFGRVTGEGKIVISKIRSPIKCNGNGGLVGRFRRVY